MDEKQIIKQLKGLRKIRPNKDWVVFTKGRILEEGSGESAEKAPRFVIPGFLRPVGRPAFAFVTLAVLAVVLVGGLFYFNSQKTAVVYQNLEGMLAKLVSQDENSKQALASLEDLQTKLEDIKLALDNLKNAKDQSQALAMTEVVKATAKRSSEMANTLKASDGAVSRQLRASLGEIEKVSGELEEKSANLQKEIFEAYLQDLQTRTLSQEDQVRLQKAEEYYNEGKESEAMILLMRIGNK